MSLPPFCNIGDRASFGYTTATQRWPTILRKASDAVVAAYKESTDPETVTQGKQIVRQILGLIEDILANKRLEPFISTLPGLQSYNETLAKFGHTHWLTAPWLFSECFLYRVVDVIIKSQSNWTQFDVFEVQKRGAFTASSNGVYNLVPRYKELSESKPSESKPSELYPIFYELVEVALWGNAIDLSLLANATLEDLQSRQGSDAIAEAANNVLCNDLPQAWQRLLSAPTKRVDFVLDNAGFEFFTDIVLGLFLLDSKLADKVVFHCKTRPWMVSDTMLKDYPLFLEDIRSFPEHRDEINYLVDRLEQYKEKGAFELEENEFWCVDLDYANISPKETKYGGAQLWEYFQDSALVIVKGDLNYRKLTADRQWPKDTPFTTAIRDLATSGVHLLALRTCKADVCVGLAPGKDEELSAYWKSQGNEYGSQWTASGKWAVVSYSSGE